MTIQDIIRKSIAVKQELLGEQFIATIDVMGRAVVDALRRGHQILVAGNGGSAADAQHFAAELAGRFLIERGGLPALALTTNSSIITAIGNDYSYDQIFSRQIDGYGKSGDVFVAITTSGNSKNILLALETARSKGMVTIGLLGRDGGKAKPLCDIALVVPAENTACVQEAHTMVVHILSWMVDTAWPDIKAGRKSLL